MPVVFAAIRIRVPALPVRDKQPVEQTGRRDIDLAPASGVGAQFEAGGCQQAIHSHRTLS